MTTESLDINSIGFINSVVGVYVMYYTYVCGSKGLWSEVIKAMVIRSRPGEK